MSCLLFVDDEETTQKINIDELYEKKQNQELKQLSIFNKILNRIHKRITFASRFKPNDKHIWFTVPEYIFGEPIYNNGDCIGYLFTKMEENGFHVRYVHPNTLFIDWSNWIPSYVRNQVKKKTGMVIDEKGNVISKKEEVEEENATTGAINEKNKGKPQKEYTPIGQYKPSGNLVYNPEMFEKLERKVSFQP